MSLMEQVERCWIESRGEAKVNAWASALVSGQEKLIEATKKFREWAPLRVYLSVDRATKPRVSYSLRYQGQQVAELLVIDRPQLKIDLKTTISNQRFKISTQAFECFWNARPAVDFRKHFRTLDPPIPGRSPEHRIESMFLEQMSRRTRSKFNGSLKNIQPVLLAGCPFQLPVPISASSGMPVAKKGNVDIVARRGVGNRTRIAIWELKAPGVKAHAIQQVYIYGVTLIKMLRSESSGEIWYKKIFGFGGRPGTMPDRLTIECVVAVSYSEQRKLDMLAYELRKFLAQNQLQIGNDKLKFYLANYIEERGSLTVKLLEM